MLKLSSTILSSFQRSSTFRRRPTRNGVSMITVPRHVLRYIRLFRPLRAFCSVRTKSSSSQCVCVCSVDDQTAAPTPKIFVTLESYQVCVCTWKLHLPDDVARRTHISSIHFDVSRTTIFLMIHRHARASNSQSQNDESYIPSPVTPLRSRFVLRTHCNSPFPIPNVIIVYSRRNNLQQQ